MASLSDEFNTALQALSRGDVNAARIHGEKVLKAQPSNPSVLQLMGVIASQAGDFARSAVFFRKALANGADVADNLINLAKALLASGAPDEALAVCERAELRDRPEIHRMRAEIFKAQGRLTETAALYDQLVQDNPRDFESWNNLGNARHEIGDLEGALMALQQALQLNDKSALAFLNTGRVLISMDRHQDACFALEKAALLDPTDPVPLIELGRTLTSINHPVEGLRALGTAARLTPGDPKIFVAMGLAFSDLSDPQKAEQAFRFALQADPDHLPAILHLGVLLEKANRLDELDALVQQAVRAGPDRDETNYLRALALSRAGQNEEALEVARSIAGTQGKAVHPAMLAQFVGQLADRLGRADEAYAAFDAMNREMAQSPLAVGVDRSAYQRDIERIQRETTGEWYTRWPTVAASAQDRPSPAFIVGFPRSGTTLLDTMIMGNSATHVLEEVPILEELSNEIGNFTRLADMSPAEIRQLRARYFEKLDAVSPAEPGKLVVDKNPLSMIRVPLIHRLFPDARIILAMRHPCDVVLSCFMQNFKPTEAMSSFLDLTNASRTYDRIFSYWEHCRAIFPIDVHMLRYEDMVSDPETVLRPLMDFIGLPWEGAALDHQETARKRGFIRTPSYAQVTEQLYTRASGRWTRYRDQMRYAIPVLAPWAERYGYGVE